MSRPRIKVAARAICAWDLSKGFHCIIWPKPGRIGRPLKDEEGNVRVFETQGAADAAHREVVERFG